MRAPLALLLERGLDALGLHKLLKQHGEEVSEYVSKVSNVSKVSKVSK